MPLFGAPDAVIAVWLQKDAPCLCPGGRKRMQTAFTRSHEVLARIHKTSEKADASLRVTSVYLRIYIFFVFENMTFETIAMNAELMRHLCINATGAITVGDGRQESQMTNCCAETIRQSGSRCFNNGRRCRAARSLPRPPCGTVKGGLNALRGPLTAC